MISYISYPLNGVRKFFVYSHFNLSITVKSNSIVSTCINCIKSICENLVGFYCLFEN